VGALRTAGTAGRGKIVLYSISSSAWNCAVCLQWMRSRLSDFRNSGFDRGHLVRAVHAVLWPPGAQLLRGLLLQVPAADMKHSQKAMDETFSLDNISPQAGTACCGSRLMSANHLCCAAQWSGLVCLHGVPLLCTPGAACTSLMIFQ
jgi:hypothetical protein